MSGNTDRKPSPHPQHRPAKPNRRTARTRDTLGDALVALMQEQPFDSITIQQLLDHAGVSRSTFYTHFRDKQDLFLSDVEDFFDKTSNHLTHTHAPAHRLAPVRELFTHVADVRGFQTALVISGKWTDVRDLGIGIFARSIEQRLPAAGIILPPPELRATAHALAGALFSLLEWWLTSPKQPSPEEMDTLFHRLAKR